MFTETIRWLLSRGMLGLEPVGAEIPNHANLGANITRVIGTKVGECAVVEAGAMVSKEIANLSLAYGKPPRVCRRIRIRGKRLFIEEGIIQMSRDPIVFRGYRFFLLGEWS